jgi:hypothetical protein
MTGGDNNNGSLPHDATDEEIALIGLVAVQAQTMACILCVGSLQPPCACHDLNKKQHLLLLLPCRRFFKWPAMCALSPLIYSILRLPSHSVRHSLENSHPLPALVAVQT